MWWWRIRNRLVKIHLYFLYNHKFQIADLGTGGSYFDAGYSLNFEGVPYSRNDFNDDKCYTSSGNIENYGDATQVQLNV